MNFSELLSFLAPEMLLIIATLGVLFIDLTTLRGSAVGERMKWSAWLAAMACAAAVVALFLAPERTPPGYLGGMLVIDPLTRLVKVAILLLTFCTALLTLESDFTDHVGEYFALLLLATTGMLFLVSTENLLLIFIALELLSLCLYVMTAFNKRSAWSAEAALKYFLFGGMSAAFLLFGLSLVYGLSGQIQLSAVARALAGQPLEPLLLVALLMVVLGFGFKVAAAPFHLWAPDVYQGAPVPSAALIASGSKVAGFFILAKVMMVGFAGAQGSGDWGRFAQGWAPLVAVVAALSVVVGNLAAIAQRSVRRLLAYSAVAQAGYMLLGLLADPKHGLPSLLFYAMTYALTLVGAFAVVAVVQEKSGEDGFGSFAGLRQRSPLLAVCLLIFMLSLAGVPPLAGFFGKFYLFAAALQTPALNLGLLWLVILAVAMSAVSLYYYLQVLKQVFVVSAANDTAVLKPARATCLVVGLLAAAVVLLGCFPNLLLGQLLAAKGVGGF